MKKEQVQHIIAILFLFLCSYGVYFISQNINLLKPLFIQASAVQQETDELERGVLSDIDNLNAITLDNAFFQTPAYQALVDRTVVIQRVPVGAKEPFNTDSTK